MSSWCLMIVVWLFLTMPRVCLQFVIVVFTDRTHLLFFIFSAMIEEYRKFVLPLVSIGFILFGSQHLLSHKMSAYLFYTNPFKFCACLSHTL